MATLTEHRSSGGREARPHVPGEVGAWVLIFGEMVFFATLFVTYLYYRAKDPATFAPSQRTLDGGNAAVRTVVLLTASLLVVLAVRALREGQRRTARGALLGALTLGVMFVLLKLLEYHGTLGRDLTPESNDFYMLYYALTGFHLLHVMVGLALLGIFYRIAGTAQLGVSQLAFIEGGACYWHMVDALWIILFPLLYLVR